MVIDYGLQREVFAGKYAESDGIMSVILKITQDNAAMKVKRMKGD